MQLRVDTRTSAAVIVKQRGFYGRTTASDWRARLARSMQQN